jgi:hypothetical protein
LARSDSAHSDLFGRAGAVVGSAALMALSGCTELAPGSDRLPQQSQSVQPDAAVAPDGWSCLDEPPPNRADPVVATIDLSLRVTDTVSGEPPDGLVGRACARMDVMCDTPLTAQVGPADDGSIHLSVRQGFDGFIELTSPTTVPTMFFINQPLMRTTAEAFGIVSTLALAGLAVQGNVPLDPTLGHVLVRTFDCEVAPAAGVELSNNLGGQVFAFVAGLPDVGRNVTAADGIGGFVNVAPRFAVLQGIMAESAREVGTTTVTVRAGWFSYGDVEPGLNEPP